MNLITRKEWGARPSSRELTPVDWGPRAVVHHTADFSEGAYTPKAPRPGIKWWGAKYRSNRQVQAALNAYRKGMATVGPLEIKNMQFMQGYHMSKGWSDLGYHYVIYPSGNIYEGRPARTWGAHSNTAGNSMPGISFAMNSELQPATPAALAALDDLADYLGLTTVIGHRWVPGNATSCPGKHLIRQLDINTSTGIARV